MNKAQELIGLAALAGMLYVPHPRNEAIPAGYVCTACGKEREHAEGCRPPRGLREVKR